MQYARLACTPDQVTNTPNRSFCCKRSLTCKKCGGGHGSIPSLIIYHVSHWTDGSSMEGIRAKEGRLCYVFCYARWLHLNWHLVGPGIQMFRKPEKKGKWSSVVVLTFEVDFQAWLQLQRRLFSMKSGQKVVALSFSSPSPPLSPSNYRPLLWRLFFTKTTCARKLRPSRRRARSFNRFTTMRSVGIYLDAAASGYVCEMLVCREWERRYNGEEVKEN